MVRRIPLRLATATVLFVCLVSSAVAYTQLISSTNELADRITDNYQAPLKEAGFEGWNK